MLCVVSQVPLFLQIHSRMRRLYSGLSESCGFRTLFEMVELKSTLSQYSHLSGLLDVFKAKLVCLSCPLFIICVDMCGTSLKMSYLYTFTFVYISCQFVIFSIGIDLKHIPHVQVNV